MNSAQPPFLGDERRALVTDLVRAFDDVASSGVPRWWSLEAPPGWGKTRCVQELFTRLANRQGASPYWPPTLAPVGEGTANVDDLRKRVAPEPASADASATPQFFWWGISCARRPGATFEALVNDLDQFLQHKAGLERRWAELVTRRERIRKHFTAHGDQYKETAVGEAIGVAASAANLAVPGVGLLLLLAKWGAQRVHQELRVPTAPVSAGASAVDELAPVLERLGAAGLPMVVVVEDVHLADATLVELLVRLVVAQESRVLLVTTAWSGLLTEPGRACSQLRARLPTERVWRALGEVEPGTISVDERTQIAGTLSIDERTQIAQAMVQNLDDGSARLLAARYENPWELQTGCRLGSVQRSSARGPLSPADVDELPRDASGLFRNLWLELPEAIQRALMLSVLSAPTSVGERLSFSEDRWDPSVVQAALEVEGWLWDQTRPFLADLGSAGEVYGWVRAAQEWLQRFRDPTQRDVALSAARREYSNSDRQALYSALVRRLEPTGELTPDRQRHGDRLVLALAAKGSLSAQDSAVIDAGVRVCRSLTSSPAAADQRLILEITDLILGP